MTTRRKISVLSLALTTLLTGCAGQNSPSQSSFDASSDIAAIESSVRVFQELSDSARSDDSVENMARVAGLNSAALDGIEKSTSNLLKHITDNWDSIGSGDSPEGISREVLKEWGEAYLFWVEYQRKIQTIVEECLANLENFNSCRRQKVTEIVELERQSTEPLNVVQVKIQAWQQKYANQ